MQHTKELTRDNVPHTKKIMFWSPGQMHTAAFERWSQFSSTNQQENAKAIATEWVITPLNTSKSLNTKSTKHNHTSRSNRNAYKEDVASA